MASISGKEHSWLVIHSACSAEAHIAVLMQVSNERTGSRSSPHYTDVTNESLCCCTTLSAVITLSIMYSK